MTIKKTVTIEGVRSWTGPMENYEAHKECVEHWCSGGDVEVGNKEWDSLDDNQPSPSFLLTLKYRNKRREPRYGEVWIVGDIPCIYSAHCVENFRFIQLDGTNAHNLNASPVYAAPSVEAYIAKKLLDKVEQYTEQGFKAHALYEVVESAAGEEK